MAKVDLLQGTLDMLVLRVLSSRPLHGWGIADRIQTISENVLNVGEGSLYPALYRLEERGWVQAEWGQSENNRRAKFYSLTKLGKKQLETERESWDRLTGAISAVMRLA